MICEDGDPDRPGCAWYIEYYYINTTTSNYMFENWTTYLPNKNLFLDNGTISRN